MYPSLGEHALCSSMSPVAVVISALSWLFLVEVYIPDDVRAHVILLDRRDA